MTLVRKPLPTGADRQHFRADGMTKIGWLHKADAKRSAKAGLRNGRAPLQVYRCPDCRLWHHGNGGGR